jgi:hypothetical protein
MLRRYLLVVVAPVAGILLALAVGVSPRRLRPAVEFQAVALVATLYFIVALKAQRRTGRRQRRLLGTAWSLYGELFFHLCKARARRQREGHVPRNVRLRIRSG